MNKSYLLSHEETMLIEEALGQSDGIIAFPTDTVYGIGCKIDHEEAVQKIYRIKQRDNEKPLILLGSSLDVLKKYVKYIPDSIMELINTYWPGPLTVVLPKSRYVPDYVTANLDSVGIRIPAHPVFLELLKRCVSDNVLATTSANLSNQPELITYQQVQKVLGDQVDYLLEDYNIPLSGLPSTIVSIDKNDKLRVLRQGAIVLS